MKDVLPASSPPDDSMQAARARDGKIFVALLAVIMVLTWLLGVLVLQGTVAPRTSFGWMTFLCLIAAGWYGYGYLREGSGKDPGLVLSASGWLLAELAAFAQFLTDGPDTNPAVTVFGWLAGLLILAGAIWSLIRWFQSARTVQNSGDDS